MFLIRLLIRMILWNFHKSDRTYFTENFCSTLHMYIYYIPPPLTVHFSMTRSVRYQPIFNTLYYTLHTEHAYCLSYRFLNNVVITTVIEMVELVEILYRRLGKRSVERVRYVIGERAKRARHSQVCSIENHGYIMVYYGTCNICSYNP